jgi:hypothetical protein
MTEQFAVVRRVRTAVHLFHRYWQINQNDKRKSVFSCKSIFSITSWINWIYDPPLSTLLRTQIFYGGMNAKFALPNLTFIFSVILLGLNIVNFLNAEFKFGLTPYACYHFLSLCGLTGSIYSSSFCRFPYANSCSVCSASQLF